MAIAAILVGVVLVPSICVVAFAHARSRFGSFLQPLGGRLGLFYLRFERAGFKFVASAELFGHIHLGCRRFRTRYHMQLRSVRSRSWPAAQTASLSAQVHARIKLSDELLPVVDGDEELQRGLIRLTDRVRLQLRASHEGLRAALRPQGKQPLAPQDLSDFADWLIALHARLDAAGGLRAERFSLSRLPRVAGAAGLVLLVSSAVMLPIGMGMGRSKQLMSGDFARLSLHAIPIALAIVVPICAILGLGLPEERRARKRRVSTIGAVAVCGPMFVWASMILLNHYLDTSPAVVHDVEILSVSHDSKDASVTVRAWAEGRETEWFPMPAWLKKQLTPDSKRILVEVHAGALGYEHVTALQLTGD